MIPALGIHTASLLLKNLIPTQKDGGSIPPDGFKHGIYVKIQYLRFDVSAVSLPNAIGLLA